MTSLPPPPRYGGSSLADVLPSAAAWVGAPGFWDLLGMDLESRCVVVLLVDGLGYDALVDNAALAPVMTAHAPRALDAAIPTTTPTGLASLGTGMPPGRHGIVGASFRVEGHHHLLHPLGWQDTPSPRQVQPHQTVFERVARSGIRVGTVSPRAYAQSGLTIAGLRGGEYRGADSVGERMAEVESLTSDGRALVYVYWPDLDRTGHVHGVDSDAWRAELGHVDALVDALRARLAPDCHLVVTSDHGMVDVEPSHRLDVDAHDVLRHGVLAMSGEPRCRYLYVSPRDVETVRDTWRSELGDRAWVVTRREAVEAGYFGPVEEGIGERVGDVIAWCRDGWALASRVDERVSALRGQHGSITHDEVSVPLIVMAGGR